MPAPQPAIFATGTRFHWFLHYRLRPAADLGAVRAAIRSIRQEASRADVNLVVGFGSTLARDLLGAACPPNLEPFREVVGKHSTAVATQEDVFLWLHSHQHDENYALARESYRALRATAELARETPSWVFRDSLDLTGFIDGTANPGPDEAPRVALVPDPEPGAGGSFVIAQRWIHDLDAFEALPVPQQEAIIGRTKADSVAIQDRPATAHITRTELERDGVEQEIYRRSVSYGNVGEAGLYFLAFCRDPSVFDGMLARMYGTSGDGLHDRLTEFTAPVSGAYYFAPSEQDLERALG